MWMLVAGVVVLVAAFAPTSASAVDTTHFLPPGTVNVTYTCGGADQQTQTVLGVVGLSSFNIAAVVASDPVAASPENGDSFDMTFFWTFTQDQTLVETAVGLGVTDLQLSNGVNPVGVVSGATGPDVVGNPPTQDVPLGDGSLPITYSQGPFTGSFTRAGNVGDPIVFKPGNISVTALPNPLTTSLNLACTPDGATMTLVDQEGEAPPTTRPTTTTLPPTTASPTTAAGPVVAAETQSQLARTGFHSELLILGIALLGFGYALSLTGRRVAKASARSRS
jgi:hypothetical protein